MGVAGEESRKITRNRPHSAIGKRERASLEETVWDCYQARRQSHLCLVLCTTAPYFNIIHDSAQSHLRYSYYPRAAADQSGCGCVRRVSQKALYGRSTRYRACGVISADSGNQNGSVFDQQPTRYEKQDTRGIQRSRASSVKCQNIRAQKCKRYITESSAAKIRLRATFTSVISGELCFGSATVIQPALSHVSSRLEVLVENECTEYTICCIEKAR